MMPEWIKYNLPRLLLASLLLLLTVLPAQATTLSQSVELALQSNPQLQTLIYSQRAIEYDLKQAKGGYLPSVDLLLGYGYGQISEDKSKNVYNDPNDNDWKSRSDATIRLTQKVYDGGETGNQVLIRKAQLSSADHWTKATAQSVALNTITAHLNVFEQQELISLAKNNLQIHRNIYQSLAEREQSGAGNIADVTQVQARLARAESTLYLSQADLNRTVAKYTQVVGSPPQQLTYAADPKTLPENLTTILQRLKKHNPEFLAVSAEVTEADSRLALARVNYKPKLDLELSSRYTDHLDGNESWKNSNAAMLNLSWNLFNGGQDKAGISAALQRKNQSHSKRAVKLAELTEEATTAWAEYGSLQRQKAAYLDAVDFSRKTFEAYLIQFSYSQRSLLDLLSAENEYFQSAVQLIRADIDATISAYHLLALTGNLQIPRGSDVRKYPEDLTRLSQALKLPFPHAEQQSSSTLQKELLPKQKIRELIDRWAAAWRAQDTEAYLACYSNQFAPGNTHSHREWQLLRSKKLATPTFIDLSISDLQIHQQSNTEYLADFIQGYRSNKYSDQVRKKLTLKLEDNSWKITNEQTAEAPGLEILPSRQDLLAAITLPATTRDDETVPELLPSYAVVVGPCINKHELKLVHEAFNTLKLEFKQSPGVGKVKFVRLLEGIYPVAKARAKLSKIKKRVNSAYLLPEKDQQLGLYLGSFHDANRAAHFAEKLGRMGISTEQITTKVEMKGEILTSQQTDKKTAQLLRQQLTKLNVDAYLIDKN